MKPKRRLGEAEDKLITEEGEEIEFEGDVEELEPEDIVERNDDGEVEDEEEGDGWEDLDSDGNVEPTKKSGK